MTLFLSINPPHIGISTSRKGPQTQTVVTVCGSLPTNYDQARDHGHNKTSVQMIAKTILSLRVVENNDRTQMATLQRHCPLKCHGMNFLSGPAHTQTTIFSTSEPCDLYWLNQFLQTNCPHHEALHRSQAMFTIQPYFYTTSTTESSDVQQSLKLKTDNGGVSVECGGHT